MAPAKNFAHPPFFSTNRPPQHKIAQYSSTFKVFHTSTNTSSIPVAQNTEVVHLDTEPPPVAQEKSRNIAIGGAQDLLVLY
jgi:hypothetical protein